MYWLALYYEASSWYRMRQLYYKRIINRIQDIVNKVFIFIIYNCLVLYFITINNMETTNNFIFAVLDDEALDFTSNRINFEVLDDTMDGCFARVCDWTRFANRINNNWIDEWFKKNWKYYEWITKVEQINNSTRFKIYTKNVKWFFATIGDKQLIESINGFTADINFEWYWTKNGRQNKIANWIDIYFENVKAF